MQGCHVSISLSSGFSFQVVEDGQGKLNSVVSISLSSGFSFQEMKIFTTFATLIEFQSRYRAASHFRAMACPVSTHLNRFNLVIERLLISGYPYRQPHTSRRRVSISLSSGFSFQGGSHGHVHGESVSVSISLSSGFSFQVRPWQDAVGCLDVSISLSSGFSFQVRSKRDVATYARSFNLVIERLLISGRHHPQAPHEHLLSAFQSRYRAASHFRDVSGKDISRICLFQSRYRAASHFRLWIWRAINAQRDAGFNLVIERLLISGP